MNIFDFIIIALILLAVYAAVRFLRKGKTTGCTGYCDSCPQHCAIRKGENKQ